MTVPLANRVESASASQRAQRTLLSVVSVSVVIMLVLQFNQTQTIPWLSLPLYGYVSGVISGVNLSVVAFTLPVLYRNKLRH